MLNLTFYKIHTQESCPKSADCLKSCRGGKAAETLSLIYGVLVIECVMFSELNPNPVLQEHWGA